MSHAPEEHIWQLQGSWRPLACGYRQGSFLCACGATRLVVRDTGEYPERYLPRHR